MRLTKPVSPKLLADATPLERKCLEQGVRLTPTRKIILTILEQATGHLTVEDIYRYAMKIDTAISVSTIYSNIRGLADADVINKRRFQAKQTYYTATEVEPHDQLIDIASGQVIEFKSKALDKLKTEIAQQHGYSTVDCRIELYAHPDEK